MNNIGLDEGDESDEGEKDNLDPAKSYYEALPPFKDLYPLSDIVQALKEYGPSIVPLSMIGMMMNYAGNHMLHYIAT